MRIAFDLDDTLLTASGAFETEPPRSRALGWLVPQRLRSGTGALLRELSSAGHELWVYTTSLRSPWRIRLLFLTYGVRVAGIVNQTRHDCEVGGRLGAPLPSKFPPAFGIDLLVDDSEGVLLEGQKHGFNVLQVLPSDTNWADRVQEAVRRKAQR